MHSQLRPREPGPQSVATGRKRRRTAPRTAHFWPARHRYPARWASPAADWLYPGRAPEESYRDYTFRTAIWP